MFPFSTCRLPRTDDPHTLVSVRVGDDNETPAFTDTGRQKSPFLTGMVWIINRDRQRITKHACRVIERDSMLGKVPARFLRVPFELHDSRLPRRRAKTP